MPKLARHPARMARPVAQLANDLASSTINDFCVHKASRRLLPPSKGVRGNIYIRCHYDLLRFYKVLISFKAFRGLLAGPMKS